MVVDVDRDEVAVARQVPEGGHSRRGKKRRKKFAMSVAPVLHLSSQQHLILVK